MNHLIYLGIFACIAVSCVALYAASDRFFDWLKSRDYWKNQEARELAAKDVGRSLVQLSCWYSEDMSACEAIRLIGQEILESGSVGTFDVSKTRDQWRKATGRPNDRP